MNNANSIDAQDILRIVQERWNTKEYFLEINFNTSTPSEIWDEDYKNQVITCDCDLGTVVILFDEWGRLDKIEIC